jgi:hypothetical protein
MLYSGAKYMVEETAQNKQQKSEEILSELKLVATPALLMDFVRKIEGFMRIHKVCEKAELWFDENPYAKIVQLDVDVEYSREHHLDELVCDGEKYEIEAEYEMYTVGDTEIVHSFRPLSVKLKQEE